MGKLTAKAIEHAKPGKIGDGDGLYLQMGADRSSASWTFRYKIGGKTRFMGLGRLKDVSLARARQLAGEARRLKAEGTDPIDARKEKRATVAREAARAVTFKEVATGYIASHQAGWKNEVHQKQWTSTLEAYVYPVFGDKAVSDVDTGLVLKALQPIWTKIPETASRVRGRVEVILDAARVAGMRTGENPARWRGHLSHLLPSKKKVRPVVHHAAVPWRDMPAFMAELRDRPSLSARALEFCILTATRASEACGATWAEIDLKAGVWTIPASRMKAGKEHRIPLVGRSYMLLEAYMPEQRHGHVFPSYRGRPLGPAALGKMLELMGRVETTHGFRSSFRDWAAECTHFQNFVVEMALAHAIPSGVEAAYRRGEVFEKRCGLMGAWNDYCG